MLHVNTVTQPAGQQNHVHVYMYEREGKQMCTCMCWTTQMQQQQEEATITITTNYTRTHRASQDGICVDYKLHTGVVMLDIRNTLNMNWEALLTSCVHVHVHGFTSTVDHALHVPNKTLFFS